MMTDYLVTMQLNFDELREFIDSGKVRNTTIRILGEKRDYDIPVPTPGAKVILGAQRIKRGSKVNATVLQALAVGPCSVASLKNALVDAGFAAASLSTSLAMLQKSDEIVRVDGGLYALNDKEAAE